MHLHDLHVYAYCRQWPQLYQRYIDISVKYSPLGDEPLNKKKRKKERKKLKEKGKNSNRLYDCK